MKHKPYGFYEKYIKVPQDVFLAPVGLIILSPVLLVVDAWNAPDRKAPPAARRFPPPSGSDLATIICCRASVV